MNARLRSSFPLAMLAALACATCKSSVPPEPVAADAATPVALDLGPRPTENPLDLYDVMLDAPGCPRFDAVAKLDDQVVTMRDLEVQSLGAFSRIYRDISAAREDAWRTLVERAALDRLAAGAAKPRMEWLRSQFGMLPEPPPGDADARSIWRWNQWAVLRSVLARRGEEGMEHARTQPNIWDPKYADPSTVAGRIDGHDVTRGTLRALAGLRDDQARREYYTIAGMQLDRFVTRTLREREASRLGMSVDELVTREIAKSKPPTDAEVAAYIKDNPQYGGDALGKQRARDNLRRIHKGDAEKKLDARLRASAKLETYLREPPPARFDVDVPAPRTDGSAASAHVVVALHAVGCDVCTETSRRVVAVVQDLGAGARFVSGDSFDGLDAIGAYVTPYRMALALHCAAAQGAGKWSKLLQSLVADASATTAQALADRAAAVGLDAPSLRGCIDADRYLPDVYENVIAGKRLGLTLNAAGIFVDGVRVANLSSDDEVRRQADQVVGSSSNP